MKKIAPLGIAIALVGYWGPWVDHYTAALILSGPDMGEFVKFLPEVRTGTETMVRQFFYLPPFVATISLALIAGNKRLNYPPIIKAVMLLTAIPLSFALLPPVFTPSLLLSAEFRAQFAALLLCWALLASYWLLRHLPVKIIAGLITPLSLVAASLPLWQFLSIREALGAAHGWPIAPGWGLWTTIAGFSIVMASGAATFAGLKITSLLPNFHLISTLINGLPML